MGRNLSAERKEEIDLLTNLYNRRGFNEKMNTLFAEPENLGCAMMIMADANNLKKCIRRKRNENFRGGGIIINEN